MSKIEFQSGQQDSTVTNTNPTGSGYFDFNSGDSPQNDTSLQNSWFSPREKSMLHVTEDQPSITRPPIRMNSSKRKKLPEHWFSPLVADFIRKDSSDLYSMIYMDADIYDGGLKNSLLDFPAKLPDTVSDITDNIPAQVTADSLGISAEAPASVIMYTGNTEQIPVRSGVEYSGSTNWMIGILILSVFIAGITRLLFRKTFLTYIKASYNYQVSWNIFNEKNTMSARVSVILNLLFILNSGILVYQLFEYFGIEIYGSTGIVLLPGIIIGLTFVYLVKSGVYRFSGAVFSGQAAVSEYLHQVFIYNKVFGIAVLPLIIFFPFIDAEVQPVLLKIAFILFAISIIMRLYRGLIISIKIRLSIFYIILYLCTLEIIPVVVCYKAISLLL
ncbi:MAG: DUF4271 domain-containing protein [Bacteroidota bacterium]